MERSQSIRDYLAEESDFDDGYTLPTYEKALDMSTEKPDTTENNESGSYTDLVIKRHGLR